MSLHIFGAFVTPHGTAANNRGETEGNVTTLQKLVWNGQVHSTVSAEAIRFALRRRLAETDPVNRKFDDEERVNDWQDPQFKRWEGKSKEAPFIDDDLLGFMQAEGAKQEGEKGTAKVRRAVLEVTRAVSLTPWSGDVTFNAASPGATPSAAKKGVNPVPYAAEMHATRYQYGFALTPGKLVESSRAVTALKALTSLGPVAGNHGRFLFDFSPESVVFRMAQEPAPRILYAFQQEGHGRVHLQALLQKVKAGDVPAVELVLGGGAVRELTEEERGVFGKGKLFEGVQSACEEVCRRLKEAA